MANDRPKGFNPGDIAGVMSRLDRLSTLGKAGIGELAREFKDAVDKNDAQAVAELLDSLGTAYAFISSLQDAVKNLIITNNVALTQLAAQITALDGKLTGLTARVAALERRP